LRADNFVWRKKGEVRHHFFDKTLWQRKKGSDASFQNWSLIFNKLAATTNQHDLPSDQPSDQPSSKEQSEKPSPEQGCQMVSFQTKNPNLGKFWRALEWKMLI
jgi:hypothetical protein